jgi:hypothetical protein
LWLEAGKEAVGKAVWQVISFGFCTHDGAQFGMEFKGPLAIGAASEVGHNFFNSGVGQL